MWIFICQWFVYLFNFLTQGKVKVVSENYTTSYTCPSPGYDCHVAMIRSIMSSKSSPCQAFEQNQVWSLGQQRNAVLAEVPCSFLNVCFLFFPFSPQYYVYEVSDGSTAERPRQICPYIVIACQYREPKEMPVLARESL